MVATSDEWILTRTGITERHIAAEGTGTSELPVPAARMALRAAGKTPEDVDLIILATTTTDMPLPSCACFVQQKLGAWNAAAFDLGAACAGFLFGLVTAEQYVRAGTYKTVLVVGADMISPFVDWTDRSTCVLFGDGAGAAVVTPVKTGGILSSVMGSDGRHADLLKIPAGGSRRPASAETVRLKQHVLQMSGSEVFKLAVRGMSDAVAQALKKAGVKPADVACFIPHQANMRIIEAVAERLSAPRERIFVNLQKYGNTSAASCGIALSAAVG